MCVCNGNDNYLIIVFPFQLIGNHLEEKYELKESNKLLNSTEALNNEKYLTKRVSEGEI